MKEDFQPGDIVECIEGYFDEIIEGGKYTITRHGAGDVVSVKEQPRFWYGANRFKFVE